MTDKKDFKFKEGYENKDIMLVVNCRAFGKLLNIKDCNSDNCEFHQGILEEPIYKTNEKKEMVQTGVKKTIKCGFTRLEPTFTVCED